MKCGGCEGEGKITVTPFNPSEKPFVDVCPDCEGAGEIRTLDELLKIEVNPTYIGYSAYSDRYGADVYTGHGNTPEEARLEVFYNYWDDLPFPLILSCHPNRASAEIESRKWEPINLHLLSHKVVVDKIGDDYVVIIK
jgi:hypothetical protein